MHPLGFGPRQSLRAVGNLAAAFVCAAAALLPLRLSASAPEPGGRPNILFAISDDQSWAYAGAYGCRCVRTPAFDRVAREGVLFTHAYCVSPGCSPSRAAVLTGRHTWQLEQAGTHASFFPAKYPVYPDLLEAAGYAVGFTGKGWGPGDFRAGGRSRNPAGPQFNERTLATVPKGMSKIDYAANFAELLKSRPAGKPFCFWYGGHEPHRDFEKGAGVRAGKSLESALVPPFLPDTKEIRGDILDYCVEIERFDSDLGRMLRALEEAKQLDNTLVVVTSDNGMPFPRAKANVYEHGIHMPLAIRWPKRVKGGRVVDDFVSFIDLAPTFLEAAALRPPPGTTGKSLLPLLTSGKNGRVEPDRDHVFTARERHSSARANNLGYPCRALRTEDFLYVRNFAPDRWPAGDPGGVEGDSFGFYDIDASPSKTFLLEHRDAKEYGRFYRLAVEKRPAEELFDVRKDPANLSNLADRPEYAVVKKRLSDELERYLKETGDPRVLGGGDVFEGYPRFSPIRKFE